jgi:hypothetical protein
MPGAIENITMKEWEERKEVEGNFVVRCATHRTSYNFGAAKIIFTKKLAAMVDTYVNHIRPSGDELLFLTSNGASYHQYMYKLKSLASKYHLQTPPPPQRPEKLLQRLPTSNLHIALVKLHVQNRHLSSQDLRRVTKHMGHSYDTSARYYQAVDSFQSTSIVHNTITQLICKRY